MQEIAHGGDVVPLGKAALSVVTENPIAMPRTDLVHRMLAALAAGNITLPEAQASLRALEAVRLARADRMPCQPEASRSYRNWAACGLFPIVGT